jgi:type IV pilus assembly protein PilY1
MRNRRSSFAALVAGLAAGAVATHALADDTEIFLGSSTTGSVQPNIMLILDTSGSMSSAVTSKSNYDPTFDYTPGSPSCVAGAVYYLAGAPGATPTCSSAQRLPGAIYGSSNGGNYGTLKCSSAVRALLPQQGSPGFFSDNMVQWRRSGRTNFTYAWNATFTTSTTSGFDVACSSDLPPSGSLPGNLVARNATTTTTATTSPALYTTDRAQTYWTTGSPTLTSYTVYSANYLAWADNNNTLSTTNQGTRLSVVQQAATNLLNSLSNVNVGLMRYSDDQSRTGASGDPAAQGGMVIYPISPISTNRQNLIDAVNSYTAGGFTPMSETMFEAYRYFSGGNVLYGNTSVVGGRLVPSAASSRVGGSQSSNQYQTPMQYSCQKNFSVFLTDGLPTQDNQADTLITSLPNAATLGAPCDDTSQPPYSNLPGGWGPSQTAGRCLASLTKYMYNGDLNSTLAGQQNVQSYFIGFGNDPSLALAFGYLQKAAVNGGGQAYSAGDLTQLQAALTNIVTNILQTATTFTAPTVAVNAFNRTQTLNDLYVSVFQPSSNFHWPGNVKRYLVQNGQIVDANGNPAVDPSTGFFRSSAQSFWSPRQDGANIPQGGTANQLPNWDPTASDRRNVYTFVGANPNSPVDLTSSVNYSLETANTLLTTTLLGVTTTTGLTNAINYARGQDIRDENGNGSTTDTRMQMGDPLHSQPAIVIYGGTTSNQTNDDAVIYAATNDGFLHAFDAPTGRELWSFVPQSMLAKLRLLYSNPAQSTKNYGIDGSVRVLKYDVNGDGVIDAAAGDRVFIYVGEGRGGSNYYAFDVTDKTRPKFMWSLGPSQLPGIGQSWSTPVIAKVNVGGVTQASNQKLVLIFGGGYDVAEETPAFQVQDSVGSSIYMVDAVSGSLLWSAGFTTSTADLRLARMTHAIPADIAVLDTNSDGYADRMYVGDLAGQVWRFDITNGNPRASLVAGGVIASLGAKDMSPVTAAATRRFYNAPDASVIRRKGTPAYMNVAIGSGYRGHPLNTTAQDRFYAIKDTAPFTAMTQAQYDSFSIIRDDALTDITMSVTPTIPSTSRGWKLLLNQPGSSWVGEKVLSASSTFNNQILFTTYTPNVSGAASACRPGIGLNKFYVVSVFDGSPVTNLSVQDPGNTLNNANNRNLTIADRNTSLAQSGIAPNLAFLFPVPTNSTTLDPDGNPVPTPTSTQSPVVCMSGVEVLGACRSFQSRIKTYWNDVGAP